MLPCMYTSFIKSENDNNNNDFINVSGKNLAEGISHC